jgi:hypothetical protein
MELDIKQEWEGEKPEYTVSTYVSCVLAF